MATHLDYLDPPDKLKLIPRLHKINMWWLVYVLEATYVVVTVRDDDFIVSECTS